MPFVTKHVHIVPEGFLPEKLLFVMLVPYFFLLFCPVKIFDVCFPLSGSSIFFAEGKHTQSLIGVTIIYLVFHLAQKLSCLRRCKADDLWNNHLCRTNTFRLLCYILVDIVSLNHQQKAACICVYVRTLQRIALIHQDFAIFKYRHPCIDGLVQLHSFLLHARLLENCIHPGNKGLAINLRIFSLSSLRTILNIFLHASARCPIRFLKHRVGLELVKVLFEIACLPEFCFHPYVNTGSIHRSSSNSNVLCTLFSFTQSFR